MINHPLFNVDDDDPERAKKNIHYINIREFKPGNKTETLTNQWEPEQLLTPSDVFMAVGHEGSFELVGRGPKHQVVDRQYITVKAPAGWQQQPGAMPQQSQVPQGQPTVGSTPLMQAGGLLIPSNMDPSVAMIVSMMTMQQAQTQQQMIAQQQSAERQQQLSAQASQNMIQMMLGMQQNTTQLIGSALTSLAPLLVSSRAPGDSNNAENGFLKGIEIMAAVKEGIDGAGKGPTTDWGAVSGNIMAGIKALAEVAKQTAGAQAAPPVVPPGIPPL
jgi:hypothetical protein